MMFSQNEIYERIKAALSNEVNRIEGSFSMDNISAVSGELAKLYSMEIATIVDQYSLDTARGEYLDRKGVDFNEKRNSPDEADELYRARILEKISRPITSGNENHYIYWAKQVANVGEARCISLWDGAGTVKVVILSDTSDVPDEATLQAVKAHIEANRPVGASVTVVAATPFNLSINATLKLHPEADLVMVQESIKTVVKDYLNSAANLNKSYLGYHKIGDLLFNVSDVVDVIGYTINGGAAPLYAKADEFFKVEGVTINGSA